MDKEVQMFIEQTEKNVKTLSERFNKYKLQQIIKNNKIKKNNINAYVDRLSNAYNTHLFKIKELIQERNDKICGVCYDLEADCKLNCVHKLCKECVCRVNKCPFCRVAYHQNSKYWKIDKDEAIRDINESFTRNRLNHSELMEQLDLLEHYMLLRTGVSVFATVCSFFNAILGRHIFYREQVGESMVYRLNRNIHVNTIIYLYVRTLTDVSTLSLHNLRYLGQRMEMLHSDLCDRLNYYSPNI
jgi:hypothetical protein